MREGQWITLGLLAMGIVGGIYAGLSSVPLAIFFVMISGFANAPYSISRGVIVQRNTPREMRGRVSSTFFVLRDVAFLIGMGLAGLADAIGTRQMVFVSAGLVLVPGILSAILPGLGQPAAEWKRALQFLRASTSTTGAGLSRPVTLADLDSLIAKLPALAAINDQDRRKLIADSCVTEAVPGASIVRVGEESDAVYFILSGSAVAGIETEPGNYRALETMRAGDFFGEIAALVGGTRTANVVATEPTALLQVPAKTFRQLAADEQLGPLFHLKFFERMTRTNMGDLPRFAKMDQLLLKELRTE